MILETETFTSLLHNKAHWEFELFLSVLSEIVLGGIVGAVLWPFIKRHWGHHVDRDKADGVWDKPSPEIPDAEPECAICSCGKLIVNITNPKFHKNEYWREYNTGKVCVDSHWHKPMTKAEERALISCELDAVDGIR